MTTPHKHAQLIKAWADGATIQLKDGINSWLTLDGPGGDEQPSWEESFEYRIKQDNVHLYPSIHANIMREIR